MRKVVGINNDWYYKKSYQKGLECQDNFQEFEKVNLPHTNEELPYNYFDEGRYQFKSCYKYPLRLSEDCKGKLMFVHFEGVMAYAQVYLNGLFLGEHKGGFTPFDIKIDDAFDFCKDVNILTVVVDSSELADIPPFGGQIDYLTYGGIYREVSLGIYDPVFIKNIKIDTEHVLERDKNVKVKLYLHQSEPLKEQGEFKVTLSEKAGPEVYCETFQTTLNNPGGIYEFAINKLKDIKLWDIDSPNLYEIAVVMSTSGCSDMDSTVFGFRMAEFKPNGFYLNGNLVKLIGLNRHQSYPYVGYAMPKRVQEKDAVILKQDLHVNMVRTSHYPQSRHFLNKCDEIGLLVFEEIPGWQHIGNQQWQEVAKENVREMITRDWNYPSIVIWGVRINESKDDDEFYTDTNQIAHNLDPARQTGGVRYITQSNLLEDVYTFNDFNHDGLQKPLLTQNEVTGLDHQVPYLITEFNGHMYPTKRFDQEERQIEHSLRHLRVLNAACLDQNIAGAIGWCAFDYNTHKDFGSGDRICYHGVMDMFRLPKFASYVYKSQVSPKVEPVLEPVTFWARGERSIGGIIPLVIYTNCDYVELQFGEYQIKKKIRPCREEYSGIPFPPVIIDKSDIKPEQIGAWGMIWEDAIFKGYYQDKLVIERRFCKDPLPSDLFVSADDVVLSSSQKDATRITVKVLDQYGNLLPFIDEIIKVDVKGPARLLGPQEVVVKGGAIAFWVETLNEAGIVDIIVQSQIIGSKSLKIEVI
jgi:beta-galactosidase